MRKFYPWVICLLGALFYCYEYVLRIMPNVMTNELLNDFQINAFALGNLIAFYYYAYTPMQIPVGILMDRYGARRLLTFASLVCALGCYLFFCTTHLPMAKLGRFFIGFGSAFAFVGAMKLACEWLPKYIGLISGLVTALAMIFGIAGEMGLTYFVHHFGWQAAFVCFTLMGIALALIIWILIPQSNMKQTMLLPSYKAVLLEMKALLTNWRIWINGLVGCLLYLTSSAFAELWCNPFLRVSHQFNPAQAALGTSMVFLGWAVGGPFFGWLGYKAKQPLLLQAFGGILSALACFTLIYGIHLNTGLILSLLFCIGFFSAAQILIFSIAYNYSLQGFGGSAIALTNCLVMAGGALFQPLIGKLLDWHWKGVQVAHHYTLHDYQFALSILPVSLCVGAVFAYILHYSGERYVKSDLIFR